MTHKRLHLASPRCAMCPNAGACYFDPHERDLRPAPRIRVIRWVTAAAKRASTNPHTPERHTYDFR